MFRFFTVYGPWGRPDMAFFKFTDAILKGRPSTSTTMAGWNATSPMWRTWSPPSCAWWTACRKPARPVGRLRQPQPGRPLPHRQHRQCPAGAVAGLHRRDRARLRPRGDPQLHADAAGRGAEDLGRYLPAAGAHRLPAFHRHRRPASPPSSPGTASTTGSDAAAGRPTLPRRWHGTPRTATNRSARTAV